MNTLYSFKLNPPEQHCPLTPLTNLRSLLSALVKKMNDQQDYALFTSLFLYLWSPRERVNSSLWKGNHENPLATPEKPCVEFSFTFESSESVRGSEISALAACRQERIVFGCSSGFCYAGRAGLAANFDPSRGLLPVAHCQREAADRSFFERKDLNFHADRRSLVQYAIDCRS